MPMDDPGMGIPVEELERRGFVDAVSARLEKVERTRRTRGDVEEPPLKRKSKRFVREVADAIFELASSSVEMAASSVEIVVKPLTHELAIWRALWNLLSRGSKPPKSDQGTTPRPKSSAVRNRMARRAARLNCTSRLVEYAAWPSSTDIQPPRQRLSMRSEYYYERHRRRPRSPPRDRIPRALFSARISLAEMCAADRLVEARQLAAADDAHSLSSRSDDTSEDDDEDEDEEDDFLLTAVPEDDDPRSLEAFPASYPPSPTARTQALDLARLAHLSALSLTRERLHVEVRCVDRDVDDVSRRISRELRRERSLAVLSARHSARDIVFVGADAKSRVAQRISGLTPAKKPPSMVIIEAPRYSSVRCAAALPRRAWVYFEVDFQPASDLLLGGSSSIFHNKINEEDSDMEEQEKDTLIEESSLPEKRRTLKKQRRCVDVAVGLATAALPRDALCGSIPGSASLCSLSGALTAGRYRKASKDNDEGEDMEEEDDKNGALSPNFGAGDAVGVLAYHSDADRVCEVCFAVNGRRVAFQKDGKPTTLRIKVPPNARLYPTLTLRSADVAARCRFSADEMLRPHRASVGAPKDVPVYAVDGTRVL